MVGTGAGNAPARRLYERRGFTPRRRAGAPRRHPVRPPGADRLDSPVVVTALSTSSSLLARLRAAAEPDQPPLVPARPWRLLVLVCLALAALSLLGPTVADLRPVGVDHLGPRDHAPRPRDDRRAVVEAAAGPLHRAVLAARRRGGAGAVDPRRAHRRPARLRDDLPAGGAARRAARRARSPRSRCCSRTSSSATSARGNSEGLLVALCLWALERHLDGRRRDAFLLGFAAGLLRPEVWPFLALYGLWLVAGRVAGPDPVARDRAGRRRRRADAACCGSCRSTTARAPRCAPPSARCSRTRTRRRSPPPRSSRCSAARTSSSRSPSTSAR